MVVEQTPWKLVPKALSCSDVIKVPHSLFLSLNRRMATSQSETVCSFKRQIARIFEATIMALRMLHPGSRSLCFHHPREVSWERNGTTWLLMVEVLLKPTGSVVLDDRVAFCDAPTRYSFALLVHPRLHSHVV